MKCRVVTNTASVAIDYKGERSFQRCEFRVYAAGGVTSSALSPEKPTPGPADWRAMRDWRGVEEKIEETTPDSVEGVKARMMKLTQQIHDSMTDEQ